MFKNYFKIALRNLLAHKVYSLINILGLSVGMAVALLIGLWIFDEVSYDTHHEHYPRLAQLYQKQTFNNNIGTGPAIPRPLEKALRNSFKDDFQYLSMATWSFDHILSYGDTKISKEGNFMQVAMPEMLTLKMLKGTRQGLKNPKSVLLSASTANALFGDKDPMGKIIKIDNRMAVKVTGVYEDIPYNARFKTLNFIAPWDLYVNEKNNGWVREAANNWGNNSFQLFALVAPNVDMTALSKKIKTIKAKNAEDEAKFNPEIFLHPMSDWHLRSDFKQGVNIGGRIQYVWLFGIIGVFVLLLACINFMNLSTARSERRAKEVGIRKVIGSVKLQLIGQFLSESFLTVGIAFVLAIFMTELSLNFFNSVADKKMSIPWGNGTFWMISVSFILLTSLISGSYPAFYLSSFQPVKVLKGTFKAGKYASVPRKVLVVVQFTVSVILIIGTIIVYQQIQFIKDRPIGYNQEKVISVFMQTPEFMGKLDLLDQELKKLGAIESIAESSGPVTAVWSNNGGFDWQGKDPEQDGEFATVWVSHDYGRTIDWELVEGRDFSRDFSTDSVAILINESAVKFIGKENPVGMKIRNSWMDTELKVVGVVKDIVMESPYEPVRQTLYLLNNGDNASWLNIKLSADKSIRESLSLIKPVFEKLIPTAPFEYKFIDQEFGKKFENEERIGKLASVFAGLAIFISCLGLFGLASFMAEKRSKEIGIRKVLGATVFNLWRLLSKDFILLVMISCFIAIPVAYYFLSSWLDKYTYHTEITWFVFFMAAVGSMSITLLTVSYQALKAATTNPVKVLKDE